MIDPTQPLSFTEPPILTPQQEEIKEDLLEQIEAEVEGKLNPRQELFCQYYATDVEFFGNGVQSYIEAYEPNKSKPNWYNVARASASQLLSNINICRRINELLEDSGLNDQNVDKQLLFLIDQHEDKGSKIAAIREYNKLKQRIVEKVDVNAQITQITIKREPVKKSA